MNNAATTKKITAALAALALLALGEVTTINGIAVRRASLFGFEVAGRRYDAADAARELATLAARVRAALATAALRCAALGVHGLFTIEPSRTGDGRPCVYVTAQAADDGAARLALREAMEACRDAFMGATIINGAVFVTA